MNRSSILAIGIPLCMTGALLSSGANVYAKGIQLVPIGGYASGQFDSGASEIVAHDPVSQRLFVVNAQAATLDMLDILDPTMPTKVGEVGLLPFGGVANSVAVHDGIVAVAVESLIKTDPGQVVFFDRNLQYLNSVLVGALPDMLTFSPNGQWVLVANEGEPNSYGKPDSVDPEGSVSIIDMRPGVASLTQDSVRTAGFAAFNSVPGPPGIRIYGPGATVAQDLEPEYIAVSHDSKTAWVILQENNAMGIIDIDSATVTGLVSLGLKDHSLKGNGLDPSDKDSASGGAAIKIGTWPVKGLYMPDGIVAYHDGYQTFLVMANEGDSRDYDGYGEEIKVGDSAYVLNPDVFPNAADLKKNKALGRLKVSKASGDLNGDGRYEEIHAFGGRSFSIRDVRGNLIFDSGDQFEQVTAALYPTNFNASHDDNSLDKRSTAKGPEPEYVAIGKAFGRTYAFIGLERIGGIMVYDISNAYSPVLVDYVNTRDFSVEPGEDTIPPADPNTRDLGPEGLLFINEENSPNGRPLLVAGHEISGTTTIFEIRKVLPNKVAEARPPARAD
jgi:hypothetical protein